MLWLDAHGFRLMMSELAILAVCCVLAIVTDAYWERRFVGRQGRLPGDNQGNGASESEQHE